MIATSPAGHAHCKHCKKVKNEDFFQDSDGKKTSSCQMCLDSDTTGHQKNIARKHKDKTEDIDETGCHGPNIPDLKHCPVTKGCILGDLKLNWNLTFSI